MIHDESSDNALTASIKELLSELWPMPMSCEPKVKYKLKVL